MNFKIFIGVLFAFTVATCSSSGHKSEKNEAPKLQYTAYSHDLEFFAEADAFVVGDTANVLSHFTVLSNFKPIESGKITITLSVNGNETSQTIVHPVRKGIYSFDIKPQVQGKGSLKFKIANNNGSFEIIVPDITVFASSDEAHKAAENIVVPITNTTVFTKEQSWKIDFSTGKPTTTPFGQVIKTTALVQSAQGSEMILTAKTNGIVELTSNNILEGREVTTGQSLFSISGKNLTDNNISIKYAEAKNNFDKANADYERAKELAQDKIVSEKDLMVAKNLFENTRAVYNNLSKNFSATGQKVTCPINGFLKQVFVKNGSYVEAGQPLATISQNKTLVLSADVPSKYAAALANIQTANIRTLVDNQCYTFEQLNGKVLAYGKSANSDNFLIPVNIQIDNKGNFISGSFVEIYLKTITNVSALTIPNTALIEEQGIFFVWVQITPELFEKREVSTGKTDGIRTEIVKGLSADERIVTRGAMLIKLAQATGSLDAHSGHVH